MGTVDERKGGRRQVVIIGGVAGAMSTATRPTKYGSPQFANETYPALRSPALPLSAVGSSHGVTATGRSSSPAGLVVQPGERVSNGRLAP